MEPHLSSALRHGPFHHALRAAIKARGLPLERIRQRLSEAGVPVGIATLSSWQSGRRRPERPDSLRALEVLEGVLGLPPRALFMLLGAPRRRGPVAKRIAGRRSQDLLELTKPVAELHRQINFRDGRVRILGVSDVATVDATRSLVSSESTVVLEAVEETDRHVVIYRGEPGADVHHDVRIFATANCRIGRTRYDVDNALVMAELIFDRTLFPGDTAIARYRVEDHSGGRGTEYSRFLRSPAQQVAIEVRFNAGALPIRCWRFTRQRQGQPDHSREEITLGPHRDVHVVGGGISPGVIGVRWQFS